MYDTARRVALVKKRRHEYARRKQQREICGLSAACGVFGAMLLREDAGGYVLVAVVSFAAAAAITALCFRLRNRENQRKDGTGKPDPQKQEGKTT